MRAIIFDLDGTLVASVPDLHAAVNLMLAEEGQAPLGIDQVTSFVGNGLPKLSELVIQAAGLDMARHEALTSRILSHYNTENGRRTRPYDGVPALLHALHAAGHPLGICTNKPHAPALHVLEHFGWSALFGVVVGGDSLPQRKPDPVPLWHCAQILQADVESALYVGDSEVDAETAQRAGMPFALYSGGYRKTPAREMGADHVFDHFSELPALI